MHSSANCAAVGFDRAAVLRTCQFVAQNAAHVHVNKDALGNAAAQVLLLANALPEFADMSSAVTSQDAIAEWYCL